MLQHFVAFLVIVGLFAAIVILPVIMIRDLTRSNRDRRGGGSVSNGIAGMMTEIDRVTRPSVQYVIQVEEQADNEEDDIGGE